MWRTCEDVLSGRVSRPILSCFFVCWDRVTTEINDSKPLTQVSITILSPPPNFPSDPFEYKETFLILLFVKLRGMTNAHGSIFVRAMTRNDNHQVAQFFFNVYCPRYWFWSQLLHGVVFVRKGSPLLIVTAFYLLYVLTGCFSLAFCVIVLVILSLSLSLSYQFWMYVKRSSDLATETSFETYCSDARGGFWLAFCCEACGDGPLLGTAALVRNSDTEAEIFRMAVARDAERKGIASKLLEYVETFARKEKYRTITLWTSNAQYKGLKFYLSREFTLIETKWHTNRPMPISMNILCKKI